MFLCLGYSTMGRVRASVSYKHISSFTWYTDNLINIILNNVLDDEEDFEDSDEFVPISHHPSSDDSLCSEYFSL